MLEVILTIILGIALIFSITVVIQKRQETGEKGIKSILTPICLYLIAVTNLLAYWLDFLGLWSWSITTCFLILAAYFTRYMPTAKK